MQDIDLGNLTFDELKDLEAKVEKAITTYDDRRKREAYAAVVAMAREYGFSVEDLIAGAPRKTGTVNPPMYRHPENPSVTWTGRGRKPDWIKDALASGTPLENFLIDRVA